MKLSSWMDIVGQQARTSRATMEATFNLALDVLDRDVPGDFVECGVFAGSNAAMMGAALVAHFPKRDRKLHLFDSFDGIPAGGPEDIEWTHEAGQSACSLERVKQNMSDWGIPEEILVWHQGLFKHTLAEAINGGYGHGNDKLQLSEVALWNRIAMLRIDADLYQSTKEAIEALYPLVSPGGWVIIDDYALAGCRKAINDYMIGEGGPGFEPVYWQKGQG